MSTRTTEAISGNLPESAQIHDVDALMLDSLMQRIRLKAKCRISWLRERWAQEAETTSRQFISHAEIDALLANDDSSSEENAWLSMNQRLADTKAELDRLDKTITADTDSRFSVLCRMFSLDQSEVDFLQVCLVWQLDPSFSRLFAYLQDHPKRGYVTHDLVTRLFGYGHQRIDNTESALHLWGLIAEREVAPGEPNLFQIDSMVCDWICGSSTLDPLLVGKASIQAIEKPLLDWPLAHATDLIRRHLKQQENIGLRLIISGPYSSGRRTFAANVASQLGFALLSINGDSIGSGSWAQTYLHAQRQAFLDRTALCWAGDTMLQHDWYPHIVPFPIQFVVMEPGQSIASQPHLVDHFVEIASPGNEERKNLWRKYIPQSQSWPTDEFNRFVDQHQTTVGEIAQLSRKQVNSFQEAKTFVRELHRNRLGELAQRLECPFTWQDLILPNSVFELLRDFVYEATERSDFWEQSSLSRLFPQGRGLMALFNGPSGTGKTMAAQVIAAELGLDLYRIDLASVVSKYVGETSKNLEKIFTRTQHMDVVLLFDEADALLGKRTEIRDAHDRFANTDTNYLLQALEDYRGVAILSTNRKSNIDSAFVRRIRYVVEFPRPDAEQRLLLWRHLLNELSGSAGENGSQLHKDIETIAHTLELTGAQIKYALLASLFHARRMRQPLGLEHIVRGIDRELMKEGRAMSERERQRLFS